MSNELLIKQLIYRSNYRGCKETDILLGRFFSKKHPEFSADDLKLYDQFITEDDLLIYDWVLSKIEPPKQYSDLINNIRKFHNMYE
jgi:antitoxin CptB